MNSPKSRRLILLAVLMLNLISTTLHYTDNAIFIEQYPEPAWFTTIGVFVTLIIMTLFGLLGYWLYVQRYFWVSYVCLTIYSFTGLSSPGHYLFPQIVPMSLKMQALILSDAVVGALLIGWIIWSGAVWQEWRYEGL